MYWFGLGCVQIVFVFLVYGRGYAFETDDGVPLSKDYLVDQLSDYLNRRSYLKTRPVLPELDYPVHNERFYPGSPKLQLRPHSRLLEALETEEDLIRQIETHSEEDQLRKVNPERELAFLTEEENRHGKSGIKIPVAKVLGEQGVDRHNKKAKSVHSREPKYQIAQRSVPSKSSQKFAYQPKDPEFFEPEAPFSDGSDPPGRFHAKKSKQLYTVSVEPLSVTVLPTTNQVSTTNSEEEVTTSKTGIAEPQTTGRTQGPQNYEVVEGYFQKHNIHGYNVVVVSEPPAISQASDNGSLNATAGEKVEDPVAHAHIHEEISSRNALSDFYFTVLVAGCTASLVGALIAGGVCWYRLQRGVKAAADVEYPAAYRGSSSNSRVTTPESRDRSPTGSRASIASGGSGDRKLAQSAHMFHYQHQKQQVLAMERNAESRHGSASGIDSDDDNDEGDYTVYECPGLAPTGEMEVKNPMFLDDSTPLTPTFKKESTDL